MKNLENIYRILREKVTYGDADAYKTTRYYIYAWRLLLRLLYSKHHIKFTFLSLRINFQNIHNFCFIRYTKL